MWSRELWLHRGPIPARFASVRPENGGRLEFKLVENLAATADYALTIFTPHAEATNRAQVNADTGAIEMGEWQGEAPDWLVQFARTLLRGVLRTRQSDGDWPRRLTRWRPDPRP